MAEMAWVEIAKIARAARPMGQEWEVLAANSLRCSPLSQLKNVDDEFSNKLGKCI